MFARDELGCSPRTTRTLVEFARDELGWSPRMLVEFARDELGCSPGVKFKIRWVKFKI